MSSKETAGDLLDHLLQDLTCLLYKNSVEKHYALVSALEALAVVDLGEQSSLVEEVPFATTRARTHLLHFFG